MCTVCISQFLWQCVSGSDDSKQNVLVWCLDCCAGTPAFIVKVILVWFQKCWLKWLNIVLLLSVYVTVRKRECVCVVFVQTDKNKWVTWKSAVVCLWLTEAQKEREKVIILLLCTHCFLFKMVVQEWDPRRWPVTDIQPLSSYLVQVFVVDPLSLSLMCWKPQSTDWAFALLV